MRFDRRLAVVGAAAAVSLAAGGVGIAQAVSGSEEPRHGAARPSRLRQPPRRRPAAARCSRSSARTATAKGSTRSRSGATTGSQVEIHLDAQFQQVGICGRRRQRAPSRRNDGPTTDVATGSRPGRERPGLRSHLALIFQRENVTDAHPRRRGRAQDGEPPAARSRRRKDMRWTSPGRETTRSGWRRRPSTTRSCST